MGTGIPDLARVVDARVKANPDVKITAVFGYGVKDPYAISASFSVGDVEVCWTFARDLLVDGLAERTGMGDVCVEPGDGDEVLISLSSPEGEALLSCDRAPLVEFVEQTLVAVPRGLESALTEVEAWITELMARS